MPRIRHGLAASIAAAALAVTGCAAESDAPLYQGDQEQDGREQGGREPADREPGESGELTEQTFVQAMTKAMLRAGTVQSEISLDLAGNSLRATAAQRIDGTLSGGAMQLSTHGSLNMQLTLVDEVVYVNLGRLTSGKYARLDLDEPQAAAMFGELVQGTDVVAVAKALDRAVRRLDVVDREVVDGIPTTEYRLTVDTQQALSTQGTPQSTIDALPDTITYDFFLDEHELPHRMEFDMGPASAEMTMSDWGRPVDISAPPRSQITSDNPFSDPA